MYMPSSRLLPFAFKLKAFALLVLSFPPYSGVETLLLVSPLASTLRLLLSPDSLFIVFIVFIVFAVIVTVIATIVTIVTITIVIITVTATLNYVFLWLNFIDEHFIIVLDREFFKPCARVVVPLDKGVL